MHIEPKERNYMPLLGEKFPELHVTTTQGSMVLPRDYKGKWVVLFSHPADFTPVCTTEFYALARRADDFKKINTELIGLSMDQVFSHIKWIDWIYYNLEIDIPFPIIADEAGRVATELGMLHPEKGNNTVRAVFILDPNGFVRLILYYPQEVGRSIDEIIRITKALQVADREEVALPANWPNNELIGNKGILPPAADIDTANERREKKDCYDWWFCYKHID